MKKLTSITPIICFISTLTAKRMMLSLLGSLVFAFLESCLYKLTDGKYYTTVTQFVANIIFIPFIVEDYNYIFGNYYYKHFIFPFNIWVFELIMGFWLINLHGHNPAWNYKGPFACFYGQIDISCYPRWILLSIIQDFLYFNIFLNIIC